MIPDPDFDDLESLACGEMGLSISEFYDLTPRQFANITKGYKRRRDNESDERVRLAWETTRSLLFAISSPYMKKRDRQKDISDLYPFPWDEKVKKKSTGPKLSDDKIEETFAELKRRRTESRTKKDGKS